MSQPIFQRRAQYRRDSKSSRRKTNYLRPLSRMITALSMNSWLQSQPLSALVSVSYNQLTLSSFAATSPYGQFTTITPSSVQPRA